MVLKVIRQLDKRTRTRLLRSAEIGNRSAQARVLQPVQCLLAGLERLLENGHQLVLRGRVRDCRPLARAVAPATPGFATSCASAQAEAAASNIPPTAIFIASPQTHPSFCPARNGSPL